MTAQPVSVVQWSDSAGRRDAPWDGRHHRTSCRYPNFCTVQTPRLHPITLSKQLHLQVFVKRHGVTYWGDLNTQQNR